MSFTKFVALSVVPGLMIALLPAGDVATLIGIIGLVLEAFIVAKFLDARRKS